MNPQKIAKTIHYCDHCRASTWIVEFEPDRWVCCGNFRLGIAGCGAVLQPPKDNAKNDKPEISSGGTQ